jgi:aminoglycoside phosphotransferase (APT) family kinase protein
VELQRFLISLCPGQTFRLKVLNSHAKILVSADRPGEHYALKIARSEHAIAEMLAGAVAQTAASDRGVPVPQLVAFGEPPNNLGGAYVLQEWVDGQALTAATLGAKSENLAPIGQCLGRCIALLHCNVPEPRYDWRDRCQGVLRARLAAAQRSGNLPTSVSRIMGNRCQNWIDAGLIDEVPTAVLHGDLHGGNLVTKNNHITAVLDFDRTFHGDPIWDLAKLHVTVLSRDSRLARAFLEGYGQLSTLQGGRLLLYEGLESLAAIALLHSFPSERPWYLQRIADWLDQTATIGRKIRQR